MKTNKMEVTGGGQCKLKLLAAVAVLAIAFAVFAAVPAVAEDSDATGTTYYVGGTDASDENAGTSADVPFATLVKAVETISDDTGVIELQGDVTGAGIFLAAGNANITIDLNGHTYTCNGPAVGSDGYETQAFHLEKGNTVTIKDGTVTTAAVDTSGVEMLIQNYCDLTLTNVNVDGSKLASGEYAVSINNGTVLMDGTTSITASTGGVAFDCFWWPNNGYTDGAQITVDTTGKISGKIEVADSTKATGESKNTLNVKNGTFTEAIEFTSFNGSEVTIAEGVALDVNIPSEKTVTGSVTFGTNGVTFANITAGTGGITFSEGSVEISGNIVSGSGTAAEIEAVGSSDVVFKNLTITSGTLDVSNVKIEGKVIVSEDATLNATSNVEVTSTGSLVVGGKVTATSDALTNNGTISVTTTGAEIPPAIPGTGSVDTSAVASEGTLSGSYDTTTTFTKNQIITATGDITLVSGTIFTFEGQFIIPEGVTVTIEDGAQLIIANATGKLVNNGTIIVESDAFNTLAGGFVINGGDVENNGSIILDYSDDSEEPEFKAVANIISGKLVNNGTIAVGEESMISLNGSSLINEGTFQMEGAITQTGDNIKNSGTIVIDGKALSKVEITSTSVEAVVQVVALENDSADDIQFLVSDKDALSTAKDYETDKYDKNKSKVIVTIKANEILSGITVTLETEKIDGVTYKYLAASGNVTSSTTTDGADVPSMIIAFVGDNVISGDLVLNENVGIAIGGGETDELRVTGTITGTSGSKITFVESQDALTVEGKVTLAEKIASTGVVNAASYEIAAVGTASKQFVYTTLATAVADGATKISILGNVDIEEDITVPSGTTVTLDGSTMNVGDDAKVNFVSGAILKNNGTIDVDGVLSIEDKKSGLKPAGTITSDVIIEGETSRVYTNVAYALTIAESGETVKLSGTANPVVIDKNMTIPDGVTLDTNGVDIQIDKNVTLTVDGALFINGSAVTLVTAAEETLDKDAKIVLDGIVKSDLEIPANLKLSGAYYSITIKTDKTYYVQPVEAAAPGVSTYDVDEGYSMLIVNYGETALKIGDITLTGTDAENTVVVGVKGDVVAKSITLDNASIGFADAFSGTIASGVGSVNVNADTVKGFGFTAATDGDVEVFAIAGDVDNVTDGSKFAFTVEGEVSIISANVYSMTVDGKLTVADTEVTISTLTINGEVFVDNDAVLYAPTVEVYGTLSVAEQTSTDGVGTASVDRLLVGISKKAALGASASVTGNVDVDILAIVADGSSIAADIVKDKPFTEYYIEDALYVTAYDFTANNSTLIDLVEYKVENADANGWTGTNGPITDEAIGEVDRVDANIDYDVYGVRILSAEGVIDITIDGNLYDPYDGIVFLTAGTHKVEYTLDNGWTGTATLAVNGAVPEGMDCTIDGTNFTISGDFDGTLVLQLTGIEKSGFVPDAPDSGDNGGMTITDYLLIILVVLIVVMAIIVAMRLMRS